MMEIKNPCSLRIVGIGEALWDLLPAGPQFGGAPANFAYHARALGAEARVVTRVGKDQLGEDILTRLKEWGIAVDTVQVDEDEPTGTVTVALSEQGIPTFTIHENVAWDRLSATQDAFKAVETAHAVCFGSLAQRSEQSRTCIQKLVSAAPAGSLRVFDISLRQSFYTREIIQASLGLATVLKLNDTELPVLARIFELTGGVDRQITTLAERFRLGVVALTRGAQGSLLYQSGRWSERGAVPVQVADTVGAGDAFTAGLVIALLQGRSLDQVHELAAEVARFVCSRPGATPPLPKELSERFLPNTPLHSAAPREKNETVGPGLDSNSIGSAR